MAIVPKIKIQRILRDPILSHVPLLPEYISPMVVNTRAVVTLRVMIDHVSNGSTTNATASVGPEVGAKIMLNAPMEPSAAAMQTIVAVDGVRLPVSLPVAPNWTRAGSSLGMAIC